MATRVAGCADDELASFAPGDTASQTSGMARRRSSGLARSAPSPRRRSTGAAAGCQPSAGLCFPCSVSLRSSGLVASTSSAASTASRIRSLSLNDPSSCLKRTGASKRSSTARRAGRFLVGKALARRTSVGERSFHLTAGERMPVMIVNSSPHWCCSTERNALCRSGRGSELLTAAAHLEDGTDASTRHADAAAWVRRRETARGGQSTVESSVSTVRAIRHVEGCRRSLWVW